MNSSEADKLHIWSVLAEINNPTCAKEMAELRKMIAEAKRDPMNSDYYRGALNVGINGNWHGVAAQRRLYPLDE